MVVELTWQHQKVQGSTAVGWEGTVFDVQK